MNCPKCHHRTIVLDSVSSGAKTYRRHKCTRCEHEFYTTEREDAEARYTLPALRQERRNEVSKE